MADRIRFTLLQDGVDVRPFDFDTERIQIGSDPRRGDQLVLALPRGKQHVRAVVLRSHDYIELEVVAGPIWLQGARMDDGDVAELSLGDLLTFGSRGGPQLRYETATEAAIVMDDVADWSMSAAPKKKRQATVEDDMLFEEEEDPYAGLNPWEKAKKWWRIRYNKLVFWRKKAARIKYWISLLQMIQKKVGKYLAMGVGALAIGGGYWMQIQGKLHAQDERDVAVARETQAVGGEKDLALMVRELQQQLRECGCESSTGTDNAAIASADAILERFGGDEGMSPERAFRMPNKKMQSLAGLISPHYNRMVKDRTLLPLTLDRVCSASHDKDRMNLVVSEANRYGLHEAYTFVPFVESFWCELAVSNTGPRGMMQFTRNTAQEAFRKVDSDQKVIPNYDWKAHRKWFEDKAGGANRYYRLLAECSELVKADYRRAFYGEQRSEEYRNRIDPRDPRTDWEWSTKAAMSWLEHLHQRYKGKGFRDFDAMMLAMTAYNQGEGMVQSWIDEAKGRYSVDEESALVFTQIYGGGMALYGTEKDAEKRRRIKEGMDYAPKILGAYLAAAPRLDERQCR